LVLARVLLAEQEPGRALELLRRLHDLAAGQGRVGSLIELQALQALALAASGDQQSALAALAQALHLAWPEGYLRVFIDEGPPMASLLARLATPTQRQPVAAAEDVPPDYLARLLAAFPPAAAPIPQPPSRAGAGPLPGLVEPLSERELEVLGLLAVGRSNQQIAQELVVALDTAKSTSATSWTSSGWPTAPRPWPAPGSCSCSGSSRTPATSIARWCMPGRAAGFRRAHLEWAPSGDGAAPSHR
jgi:LuxR family maltose regulon positive regulatory protein